MPDSKKFFVANWKENKTYGEGVFFFSEILKRLTKVNLTPDREVIFCPSYPLLPRFRQELRFYKGKIPVKLGSQDVSQFAQGSYTGEVSAKLLKEFVDFAIIGHSERRRLFGETDAQVKAKVICCQSVGITPIVCVSQEEEIGAFAVGGAKKYLLAFEPPESIGSGHPSSLRSVEDFHRRINTRSDGCGGFLYGGSVDENNVMSFLSAPMVDGVIIGTASLELESLFKIVVAS